MRYSYRACMIAGVCLLSAITGLAQTGKDWVMPVKDAVRTDGDGRSGAVPGSEPMGRPGQYRIRLGGQEMGIDPSLGGRITYLTLDGRNFLTDSNIDSSNWGSTFWPSPQSVWNWPPPPAIDNLPYKATVEGRTLQMVSPETPGGLVVTKKIAGNRKGGYFRVEYSIANRSAAAQRWAPWEVTRVHTDGLAFFPMGEGEKRGKLLPLTQDRDGIVWFIYDRDHLPVKGDRQLYTDGAEGWLAEVNGRVLLVQTSKNISLAETAPEEGEVELYTSPLKKPKTPGAGGAEKDARAGGAAVEDRAQLQGYVEIEHQGAYESIPPGGHTVWVVNWYIRKLPDSIRVEAGSAELVKYVRELVRQ